MQALVAATGDAAKALRLDHKIGLVEKGRIADLLVVNGNPLEDLTLLQKSERLVLVMKDGVFVKKSI
jgi:imidazolonepropionase-like amidohydrolase